MHKKLAILLCLSVFSTLAAAGENLYEKNYQPQANAGLKSLQAEPETKIYLSNHKDEDNVSMLENGYDMMGSSDFESTRVSPDLALQFGKKLKADLVLTYVKYGAKLTGISKLETIKQAAKTTGEVDASALKDDDEQYKYFASYWAKLPPPLFGVHVIKLKTTSGTLEEGLKVLAVVKDSPAAKANLQRGDVLLKMGDAVLQKPEELSAVARQYQGKAIEIAYLRDGETAKTQATLNSR